MQSTSTSNTILTHLERPVHSIIWKCTHIQTIMGWHPCPTKGDAGLVGLVTAANQGLKELPVREHLCAVNPPNRADYPRSIAYAASHLPPCFGQGDAWSSASKHNECHTLQMLRRQHVPFSINCFIQRKPFKTRLWSFFFSLMSNFRLPTKAFVCWRVFCKAF